LKDTPEIEEVVAPQEVIEEKPPEPPTSPEPDAETEAWITGKESGSSIRPSRDAPAQINDATAGRIDLSPEVSGEMDRLWKQSIKEDGTVQEHAATLVRAQEGNVKLINPVAGDSGSVSPDRDIPEGNTVLGSFHTHPYEDGTETAFSGQDIAYLINSGDNLAIVQSGDQIFAIQRTDSTPESVDPSQVKAEFRAAMAQTDENTSFAEAVFAANQTICRKYGLALYAGQGASLKEVYHP
jgi:hypothetical protein